jgi:predicted nucleotidyltransferase
VSTPGSALQRLRDDPSRLRVLCDEHAVILLTAFGSILRPAAEPHDLDVGVLFNYTAERDVLGLRDGLVALTGYEGIDLVVLNGAGPVIRERALVGAEVLNEARKSVHARAAIAATMERMDTDWLRRLALEELAR